MAENKCERCGHTHRKATGGIRQSCTWWQGCECTSYQQGEAAPPAAKCNCPVGWSPDCPVHKRECGHVVDEMTLGLDGETYCKHCHRPVSLEDFARQPPIAASDTVEAAREKEFRELLEIAMKALDHYAGLGNSNFGTAWNALGAIKSRLDELGASFAAERSKDVLAAFVAEVEAELYEPSGDDLFDEADLMSFGSVQRAMRTVADRYQKGD